MTAHFWQGEWWVGTHPTLAEVGRSSEWFRMMDPEYFLRALHSDLVDPEPDRLLAHHAAPPGRARKTQEQIELAHWIQSMDATTRKRLELLIHEAADGAVFGLLCILDGVRVIDDGRWELWSVDSSGNRTLLNGTQNEFLHDLYRALFPARRP